MEKILNSEIVFKNEIKPSKVCTKRKTITSFTHNFTIDSNNKHRNSYSNGVTKKSPKEIWKYSKKKQNLRINKTNNDNFWNTIRKITN